MQLIKNAILSRIYGHGRGWVFTPKVFADIASPTTVGPTLSRLVSARTIRRLARGLYDYPKIHTELGMLLPSVESIAKAIAGRDRVRLLASGAYAANLLGLSQQVPAKVVFLTDGTSKRIVVDSLTIELRKTAPQYMALAGKESGLVIQALGPKSKTYKLLRMLV